MKAEPLTKEIYNKAKELGHTNILLHFRGGSDEGYLDVEFMPFEKGHSYDLANKIEDWAWNVYDYSGAGDGSDYGDEIDYDLVNNKVSTSEWYTSVQQGESDQEEIEFAEEEEEV